MIYMHPPAFALIFETSDNFGGNFFLGQVEQLTNFMVEQTLISITHIIKQKKRKLRNAINTTLEGDPQLVTGPFSSLVAYGGGIPVGDGKYTHVRDRDAHRQSTHNLLRISIHGLIFLFAKRVTLCFNRFM